MRTSFVVASCVGLVLVGAIALRSTGAGTRGTGQPANLDFTLKDMNGKDVRLADFKGRPILVNFWATYCVPCQLEMPELVDLSERFRDKGLVVIGISTDDTPEQIRQFAAQYKVSYPLLVGVDRDDVGEALGLGLGIPTSIFIKRDGTILGRLEGIGTTDYFERQIRAMF